MAAFVGAGGVGAGGRVAGKGMVCGRPVDVRVAVRRVAIENHEANAAQDPLSSIAGTVMEFMNSQHKGDLVQYIVQMGSGKVEDPSRVDEIVLSSVDQNGLKIDVVLCDYDESCVCLQEEIPWVDNRPCQSANDIVDALGKMSAKCGLQSVF